MFGREAERTRIGELLAAAAVGPVGIAIEGSAGTGKTTVWRDAVEAARLRGYRVLVAAPSEADAALLFSGLGDLLDGLPGEVLDRLPDPQRRALSAALFLSDAPEAPEGLDALPRAVLSVLRDLAASVTVVVAVDDEQWLDRASARVLAFALRRIREERICLLLSRRARSEGPLWQEARDRFAPGLEVVVLRGVDLGITQRLLASVLESKIPRRALERVHEISGGNPLYILALAGELKHTSGAAEDWRGLRVPSTLAEAVMRRLERVRAGAEAPLFAVAALANPTLGTLSTALHEFEVGDLSDAVSEGVIEIVGERVSFAHPLLASVHYASVPAPERHDLHLRLADAVTDAEERAMHLALGTPVPDERVALELEQAAGLAARRGAPEAAAELLGHACRLTPSGEDDLRWSRTATAAEQYYVAGDSARVRELLEGLLLE